MKVLIIYYKHSAVVGTIRMGGLIKYLPYFGWEPIVVTNKPSPELNKFKVVTVPYDDNYYIKKLPDILKNVNENSNLVIKIIRYLWDAFFLYPDIQKYWYYPAMQAANDLLKNQNVDLIVSSFPPVTPHSIGKSLKEKHGIPWVADMRDLWTQYSYYKYSHFFPRKLLEERLEVKTLTKANCLIIVSKPLAKILKELHKTHEDIFIIPNGFDPENVNPGIPLTEKFSITYAGGLWNGKRDPGILFDAIKQLDLENKINMADFEINFFGPDGDLLRETVEKYDVAEIVNINGLIPRDEVIEMEWRSQMLLLLMWDNPQEEGVFTGKIFEYLAAKRPIISIGYNGGVISELLAKTRAGISLNGIKDIKEEIFRAYSEFKSNGKVSYSGISEEIDKYSHKEMAKKFSDVFNIIIKKN